MGMVYGVIRDKSGAPSAGVSVALANSEDMDRALVTKAGAYDDSAETIDFLAGQTASQDLTLPN